MNYFELKVHEKQQMQEVCSDLCFFPKNRRLNTHMEDVFPIPVGRQHSFHRGWGVGAKRSRHKETFVKLTLIFLAIFPP